MTIFPSSKAWNILQPKDFCGPIQSTHQTVKSNNSNSFKQLVVSWWKKVKTSTFFSNNSFFFNSKTCVHKASNHFYTNWKKRIDWYKFFFPVENERTRSEREREREEHFDKEEEMEKSFKREWKEYLFKNGIKWFGHWQRLTRFGVMS